jgi:hypothetical protein
MKRTGHENKVRLRTVLSLVLVSAWMPLMPQIGACNDSDGTGAVKQPSSAAAPAGKAPAMKIYIDPKTGNFSDPPAQQRPTESQKALEPSQASALELRPASSPRPGGGVMIDLKGRFRNPLRVNRITDSKLTFGDGSEPANLSENK